jgi:hypothetical protein
MIQSASVPGGHATRAVRREPRHVARIDGHTAASRRRGGKSAEAEKEGQRCEALVQGDLAQELEHIFLRCQCPVVSCQLPVCHA